MKTKHLFYAAGFAALMAACTNEEIVLDAPQNVATERPTVDNVQLNFVGGDVESRLGFGKDGYYWEGTETIGALNMDQLNGSLPSNSGWNELTWLEKYALTSSVNTDYPFTYDADNKVWTCNTKMLEGNYFFAFPWEGYEGQRQVKHSLTNQQQNGVKGSVVAEAYAKNQFFVGYSQIKAGVGADETLEDVEMTPVLGAVQLRIVNTGTQTYHINKIVLQGAKLVSALTIDPLNAVYGKDGKYNLADATSFNYANYTGNKTDLCCADEEEVVYNADKNYNRAEALRAAVQPYSTTGNEDNYAQLIINGTKAERALVSTKDDKDAVAYALIMANALKVAEEGEGEVLLSIYTDEGMVANIDLTTVNRESTTGDKGTAVTNSKIKEIAPDVANTIKVQVDDNSFAVPEKMNIYTSEDLNQYVKWNAAITGAREVTATLKKNVTLTGEVAEILAGAPNVDLTIVADDYTLTLAADVPADFLDITNSVDAKGKEDAADVTIKGGIEIKGEIEITEESVADEITEIVVAEGAELSIAERKHNFEGNIINHGELNVEAATKLDADTEVTNYGEMSIEKDADVKSDIENYAELYINGVVKAGVTNYAEAVITMGTNGVMDEVTNKSEALVKTAKGSIVDVADNAGEIIYVDGADLTSANEGIISYEVKGIVNKKTISDLETNVNTLVLIGDVEFKDTENALSYTKVVVKDGVDFEVAKNTSVSITDLVIEGESTIEGVTIVENVTLKKNAELLHKGTMTVSGTFDYTDAYVLNKDAEIVILYGGELIGDEDNWSFVPADVRGETLTEPTAVKTAREAYEAAMIAAIKTWWNVGGNESYCPKAMGYDLNGTVKVGTTTYTAAEAFAVYCDWHDGATPNNAGNEMKPLTDAFAAYEAAIEAYNEDADDDKQWTVLDLELTTYYPDAVTAILNAFKGYDAEGEYTKANDKWTGLIANLKWDAPTSLAEGAARIYKDGFEDADGDGEEDDAVTAETLATRAFHAAVIDGSIKNVSATLTTEQIVMIITDGENHAPACTQVLVEDLIYDIFNATDGIGYTQDWATNGQFTQTYLTKNNAASWTLAILKSWIAEAAKDSNNSYAKVAKAYVEANNNAVLTESENWTYDNYIIQAIVNDQSYNQ